MRTLCRHAIGTRVSTLAKMFAMNAHRIRIAHLAIDRMVNTRRCVKRCLVVATVFALLVGCAGVTLKAEKHWDYFSPLLSQDDIRQIKLLIAARRDIKQPVWEIATEDGRRDHARVSSGPWGTA